jgi:hypothetical protein
MPFAGRGTDKNNCCFSSPLELNFAPRGTRTGLGAALSGRLFVLCALSGLTLCMFFSDSTSTADSGGEVIASRADGRKARRPLKGFKTGWVLGSVELSARVAVTVRAVWLLLLSSLACEFPCGGSKSICDKTGQCVDFIHRNQVISQLETCLWVAFQLFSCLVQHALELHRRKRIAVVHNFGKKR